MPRWTLLSQRFLFHDHPPPSGSFSPVPFGSGRRNLSFFWHSFLPPQSFRNPTVPRLTSSRSFPCSSECGFPPSLLSLRDSFHTGLFSLLMAVGGLPAIFFFAGQQNSPSIEVPTTGVSLDPLSYQRTNKLNCERFLLFSTKRLSTAMQGFLALTRLPVFVSSP